MISGGGRLGSLPIELEQLDKLQILDLWRNNLSAFPIDLGKMNNLRTVNLGQQYF